MGTEERLDQVITALAEIKQTLALLLAFDHYKADWYTTEEFARLVGRSGFQVRQWCRHRRIHCKKKSNGRSWVISHEELLRYRSEGLLPLRED
jgi:hypothetical protein